MLHTLYLIILSLCILSISIITLITDLKHGKILNKHILLFLKIGGLIQALNFTYLVLYEKQYFVLGCYILNCLIGIIISIMFYHFEIWGAGDSKYIILLLLIFPVDNMGNSEMIAYQGLIIFIMIFSIAFIYLIAESLYLFIKGSSIVKKDKFFNIIDIKSFLNKWLFSFSIITIIYKMIGFISMTFLMNNILLIRIFSIVFMLYFLEKMKNKKVYILVVLLAIAVNLIDGYLNPKSFIFNID